MYNIDFNKCTIDELKVFEKEIHNTIKTRENEERTELLTNIIKALRAFEKRFPGEFIGEFDCESYYAGEIADEIKRCCDIILKV